MSHYDGLNSPPMALSIEGIQPERGKSDERFEAIFVRIDYFGLT
jgi:hypothetical protein